MQNTRTTTMPTTTTPTTRSSPSSPSRRAKRRLVGLVALLLSAVPAVGAAAVGPASASPAVHIRSVRGTFLDPGANITNLQPSGDLYTFDVSGGTQDQGDMSGSTRYEGSGTVDLANDRVVMDLRETFTGSVKGYGTGTLLFLDHAVTNLDSTSGSIGTVVVSGTGGLTHVRGLLGWSWTTRNVDGSIPGEYHGALISC
jgi:hypothetical protein